LAAVPEAGGLVLWPISPPPVLFATPLTVAGDGERPAFLSLSPAAFGAIFPGTAAPSGAPGREFW
jgi:hypothetical protein